MLKQLNISEGGKGVKLSEEMWFYSRLFYEEKYVSLRTPLPVNYRAQRRNTETFFGSNKNLFLTEITVNNFWVWSSFDNIIQNWSISSYETNHVS